jgi:hypothetical protein
MKLPLCRKIILNILIGKFRKLMFTWYCEFRILSHFGRKPEHIAPNAMNELSEFAPGRFASGDRKRGLTSPLLLIN